MNRQLPGSSTYRRRKLAWNPARGSSSGGSVPRDSWRKICSCHRHSAARKTTGSELPASPSTRDILGRFRLTRTEKPRPCWVRWVAQVALASTPSIASMLQVRLREFIWFVLEFSTKQKILLHAHTLPYLNSAHITFIGLSKICLSNYYTWTTNHKISITLPSSSTTKLLQPRVMQTQPYCGNKINAYTCTSTVIDVLKK